MNKEHLRFWKEDFGLSPLVSMQKTMALSAVLAGKGSQEERDALDDRMNASIGNFMRFVLNDPNQRGGLITPVPASDSSAVLAMFDASNASTAQPPASLTQCIHRCIDVSNAISASHPAPSPTSQNLEGCSTRREPISITREDSG